MAARQLGLRVGVDVAIRGTTTPRWRPPDPPLTSVNCLVLESGRQACRQLIELIQADQPVVKQLLLQPNLVIRASSGTSRA
jgi:DNA-binding LacI/PurR family transcriptional regulator